MVKRCAKSVYGGDASFKDGGAMTGKVAS